MNTTRNNFFVMLGILIALAALYGGGLWYVYKIDAETTALVEKTAAEQKKVSESGTLERLAREVDPHLEQISQYIVPEDSTDFIGMIDELAKSEGVDHEINSLNEMPGDQFNTLVFQVTAEGSWQKTMHFVSMIASLPYKVTVSEVSMTLLGEASTSAAWQAGIQFSALKQKASPSRQ